jgi:hypothetical protein
MGEINVTGAKRCLHCNGVGKLRSCEDKFVDCSCCGGEGWLSHFTCPCCGTEVLSKKNEEISKSELNDLIEHVFSVEENGVEICLTVKRKVKLRV